MFRKNNVDKKNVYVVKMELKIKKCRKGKSKLAQ